jgi:hypothetical protein
MGSVPSRPLLLCAMAEKAKPKKKTPSIRERKLIKGIIEGKSGIQAMKDAGYADSTAWKKGSQKLAQLKPNIQELMEKKGLTDDYLIDGLMEGTKATKVISATIVAKNGEGMKDADSMSKDFIDVEDYLTRHKYIETGFKLKGHLRDKIDLAGDVTIEIISYRGVSAH